MKDSLIKQRPLFTKGNTIKIKVPARVAFDLESMNKATYTVLDELGCPACHSGFDLRFDFEREFVFDLKLNLIR